MNLPRMGKEELKSISSMGNARQPRTSTPVEGARPWSIEEEPMEMNTPAAQNSSRSSSASAATHPVTQGESALQARAQSAGLCTRLGPKTKPRATDQQGVCDIVVGVLERQGISQENWERLQRMNYPVELLRPPTWVVHQPPGQHLAMWKVHL